MHSWCRWLPPESPTLWRCPRAADLHRCKQTPFIHFQNTCVYLWMFCIFCYLMLRGSGEIPSFILSRTNHTWHSTVTNQHTGNANTKPITSLKNLAHHGDWWSGCNSQPSEEWPHPSPKMGGGGELLSVKEETGDRCGHDTHCTSCQENFHTRLCTHMHRCTHLGGVGIRHGGERVGTAPSCC